MFWWILYAYLSLQAFILAGILLLLLRDKLKASRTPASDTVEVRPPASMRPEDQQQAYE